MPKFIFDLDLDCWVSGIEIEADSLEKAEDALRNMSAEDIIDAGTIKEFDVNDVDVEEDEDDLADAEYDEDEDE